MLRTPSRGSSGNAWQRVLAFTCLACLLPSIAYAQFPCGDCNGDGIVNVLDALEGARHAVSLTVLTGDAFRACDVNSDQAVDVLDALAIAQSAAGLSTPLLCLPEPLPAPVATYDGRFATAGVCATCHQNTAQAQAMRDEVGQPIAPFDLFQATTMANSARDPYWRATVSAEAAATPSLATEIEQKCMSCHAPMASTEAQLNGEPLPDLSLLRQSTPRAQIALDGASCTLCHQIRPDQLGTPASYSGGFVVDSSAEIFGPHAMPRSGPMTMMTGYTPVQGAHTLESSLCATCHTLYTDALTPGGVPTGDRLPEQTPYLEWRNSIFTTETALPGPQAASCQDCHLPKESEAGVPLSTRIATRPSGQDQPMWPLRSPYGRHVMVGGNTLLPSILRDNAATLQPLASAAAFDEVIAATLDQLANRTAQVSFGSITRNADTLSIPVNVQNLCGHKFPTSYPSRRAWIQLVVRDSLGAPVFESGGHDMDGRIVDSMGAPLASEVAGGPIEPHHETITSADDVQVYEAVMADPAGAVTFRLLRAASYTKDNRILPQGYSPAHPDAMDTLPAGVALDADYTSSSALGADTVTYQVFAPASAGPYTIEANLLYQPISHRWAEELFTVTTPQVQEFQGYWNAADRTPSPVGTATTSSP